MIKFLAHLPLFLLISGFLWLNQCKNVEASGILDAGVPENALKAAYLIHLSEFTTWPAEKMQGSSFFICIASDSPLKDPLMLIAGRSVKNKKLEILIDVPADKLSACHVFYVEKDYNKQIFQQSLSRADPILTVSSDAGFAREGGVIEYYPEGNKVRMRVNLKAMEHLSLTISSKILRLMDSSL